MATIESLENIKSLVKSRLGSSPTAYGSSDPSYSDVSLGKQLASVNKQIEDLKGEQLGNKWYGDHTNTEEKISKPGLGIRILNSLQKPLNATMGAIQYGLGKGKESSLVKNVNTAMKEGTTAGDILAQYNVPRAVQIPLGFALDVALDPITAVTAGSTFLLPRVAEGAIKGAAKKAVVEGATEVAESGLKGAVKGATAGLVSGVQKDAASLAHLMPFTRKLANMEHVVIASGKEMTPFRTAMVSGAKKYNKFVDDLTEKAVKSSAKYDTLTGENIYSRMNKGILGAPSSVKVGEVLEDLVNKIPETKIFGKTLPSGEKISEFFKYSPSQMAEINKLNDTIEKLYQDNGLLRVKKAEKADFSELNDVLSKNASIKLKDTEGNVMEEALRDSDGALKGKYFGTIKMYDTESNAKQLLTLARKDYDTKLLAKIYNKSNSGEIGVKWADKVIDKLKSTSFNDAVNFRLGPGMKNIGQTTLQGVKKESDELVKSWNFMNKAKDIRPLGKILGAYPTYMTLFKAFKVPMNVASHVVAHIGNFFMGTMMGLPVYKPAYYNYISNANKFLNGRLGANGIKELFFNDVNSLIEMAYTNPTSFRQLTGMNAFDITSRIKIGDVIKKTKGSLSNKEDIGTFLEKGLKAIQEESSMALKIQGIDEAKNALEGLSTFEKEGGKVGAIKKSLEKEMSMPTASSTVKNMGENLSNFERDISWTTSELDINNATLDKLKGWISKQVQAQPNNPVAKMADFIINSMPRWYEQIDQTWKIGTVGFLTQHGLNEKELMQISRTVNMTKDDIIEAGIKDGEKLYKLKPLKATEVAMETFMNYAAMPDFVKVMRSVPFLNSPFYSFPYAMAIKTGKAAIDNPAIFNKVGFMINEMNASRTPEERAAMNDKYNTYLKSPTVVKVSGMFNTNVKNWIPWYSLNMISPNEQNYEGDSFSIKLANVLNNVPAFQNPIGQIWKDYYIIPWVLSGSGQAAQGQFGQALYPVADENKNPVELNALERTPYAARAFGESLMPGSLGYLGILNSLAKVGPEAIEYVPLYGFRNIANATQGRTTIGEPSKEDAFRKTIRAVISRTGIPYYQLDPTKVSNK